MTGVSALIHLPENLRGIIAVAERSRKNIKPGVKAIALYPVGSLPAGERIGEEMFLVKLIYCVLKLTAKALLVPVIIALCIIQCLCDIIAGIAARIFDLLGFIFILTGILTAGFGLDPASEVCRMILTGVIFCLIPRLIEWLSVDLAILSMSLKTWFLMR